MGSETTERLEVAANALLRRAQGGDMDAFAELFEPLRPMVHAVASRLVGDGEAEDVVMETFLKAWQSIPRFGRRSSLKTWLYRITHNCAVDLLRARARHRARTVAPDEREASDTLERIADPAAVAPDEGAERSDLAAAVADALGQLGDAHRATLQLRFVDGLGYAEIAAATGASIGTVMSRIFYGRRKLRRLLEGMAAV